MLTVREFNAAADRFQFRRFWPLMLVYWLFVGIPVGLLGLPAFNYLTKVLGLWWFVALLILYGALLVVMFPVGWVSRRVTTKLARRDPRLVCPHCDRFLWMGERRRIVASRNCPGCDGRVLADPATPSPLTPLLSRGEVEVVHDEWRRRRRFLVWGVTGGVALGVVSLVAASLSKWGVELWLLVAVNLFPPFLALLIWAIQPLTSLRCPHCGARCLPGFVLHTGRCGKCGQFVFTNPTEQAGVGVAAEPSGG